MKKEVSVSMEEFKQSMNIEQLNTHRTVIKSNNREIRKTTSNYVNDYILCVEWQNDVEMVREGSQCPSDPPCDTSKEASLKNDSKYVYC